MSNYEMIELSDEAMEAVAGGGLVELEIQVAIATVAQETTVVNIAGDDIESDVTAVAIATADVVED
ncbi:MAG: hypothetical protein QNJ65_23955 [Xenococcaceae cyanobacterium MO_234.B1]|nr:hypothetical protein [Xenococcaceae cyanobacterium MO_234.B1]